MVLSVHGGWDENASNPPSPALRTNSELASKRAAHLEKLKKTSIDKFTRDFLRKKLSPAMQAQEVKSFLKELFSYVSRHALWKDEEEKELARVREDLERYLFSKIYKSVFSNMPEGARDAFYTERISRLRWVTASHLEIDPKSWNNDLWEAAVYELDQLSTQYSPSDKLNVILNCCKVIIFLLSGSEGAAGADDLVPHLVYILIKANPPNLASNLEFIEQYATSEVMKMEKSYYFTSVKIGVSFIESLDSSRLKIDPSEYDRLMNDVSDSPAKLNSKMVARKQQKAHKILGLEITRDMLMRKFGVDIKTLPTLNGDDESSVSEEDRKILSEIEADFVSIGKGADSFDSVSYTEDTSSVNSSD